MFERIAQSIRKQGIHDAFKTVLTAGLYYNGTQHGELFDAVLISVDKTETDYSRRPIEKAIRQAIRNRDGITFRPQECNPYYYTYWIARAADFNRADQLNRISRAYLEGFWQAIHDHGDAARANNAALAIEAGHAAIQAAGISA